MSYHRALLYLWGLFDAKRVAGPVIVAACDTCDKHFRAVHAAYGERAFACYTKPELDKLAGLA